MPIQLLVKTYRNEPLPELIIKQFGPSGGTIGRAIGNGLVLEDPSKYISRTHARIDYSDGYYLLTDIGSNRSLINDQAMGDCRQNKLNHGDILTIGDYVITVIISPEDMPVEPVLSNVPPPAQIIPELELTPTDSLANASILDVVGTVDHDPLGLNQFTAETIIPEPQVTTTETPQYYGSVSDHVAPQQQAFPLPDYLPVTPTATPAAAPAATFIPDDYDPLADLLAPIPPAHTPVAEPVALVSPTVSPIPVITPPSTPASDNEIVQALLRGMGLPDLQVKLSPVEFAELTGQMLRAATAGTMDVLMARSMIKNENRLEMTMVSANANNPLKFFPDASSVLTQMINKTMPGYMAPVQAYNNAFDDLKAHELAILAGMRAALQGVLESFEPSKIEEKLQVPTMLDKVLGMNRRAKLWEGFVEHYTEMSREADADFQRAFGEKFASAYEEQIARLRQNKNNER